MPNECRVFTRRPAAPCAAVLDELSGFELAWLADSVGVGLMTGIGPAYQPVDRAVGPAVTVSTAPGDFAVVPWAVDQLGRGDVLVVDGAGDGSRAVWGDFVGARAKAVGCAGVVVDGAVRDLDGIRASGLPVYARSTTPRGPLRRGPGAVNVPVSCGGVRVLPGDVVVADGAGIIVIPSADVAAVVVRARARGEIEMRMRGPDARADWAGYLDGLARNGSPPAIYDKQWDD
jgi:RraA family protein